MRATIDGAGRLVVPKSLRDELGLTAGTELELSAVDGRLEAVVPSRVAVEEGPHGLRFAAPADDARLTAEQVRAITERGAALTADTSAIVAALSAWHDRHEAAAEALAGVRAVPAHALLESYSVLTRLPGGLAVPPPEAVRVLDARFDAAPLRLDAEQRRRLLATLAEARVHGGASHDALVGLEAAAHGRTLITLDERAQQAYRRLGVAFRAL